MPKGRHTGTKLRPVASRPAQSADGDAIDPGLVALARLLGRVAAREAITAAASARGHITATSISIPDRAGDTRHDES